MKNTLYRDYLVSSYDVNPAGKARLTAIANYLQETAYAHAGKLGLGYTDLAAKNIAWILSRMRIRMLDYPVWDETLHVETWPRGLEKLFALRDFRITNSHKKNIAEATTCWIMVDTNTHRPLRISEDFISFESRTDAVFDSTPGKIDLPKNLQSIESRKVKYSDLDVVGHVNNVKYIEWCTDVMDPEIMIRDGISDFEINYISESRLGDEIEIMIARVKDNQFVISGVNMQNGKECFRAKASL